MKTALGLAILTAAAAAAPSPPVPVKHSTRNETTPAAGGEYFAWARSRRGRPNVYDVWAQRGSGRPFKVNAPKTRGWAGGIDGTRLVYQQVKDGWKSDIRFFDLARRRRSAPPAGVNTSRWEWAPSLSGGWLLFGRGEAVRDSLQQVILQNLTSREKIVLDSLRSKNGFLQAGQVNGNFAVWGRCSSSFPQCDVYRYEIAARTKTPVSQSGETLYAPSVTATGTTYYGRNIGRECGGNAELVKTTAAGVTEVLHSFPPGQDLTSSFALVIPARPPARLETTRIYFERVTCSSPLKWDIYYVDDVVQEPEPPSRPERATITSSKNSPARRPVRRFTCRR